MFYCVMSTAVCGGRPDVNEVFVGAARYDAPHGPHLMPMHPITWGIENRGGLQYNSSNLHSPLNDLESQQVIYTLLVAFIFSFIRLPHQFFFLLL